MFHKMILTAVATLVATSAFAANNERPHERDRVDAAQATHAAGGAGRVNSDAQRMTIANRLSNADEGVLQGLVANRAFANDAAAQAGLDRVLLRASQLVGTQAADGSVLNEAQSLEVALNEIGRTTSEMKEACK
jgi:hypothetical protein